MRKHTPPAPSTPFMNVRDAARATGLSEYYLRKELAKGTMNSTSCSPSGGTTLPPPART